MCAATVVERNQKSCKVMGKHTDWLLHSLQIKYVLTAKSDFVHKSPENLKGGTFMKQRNIALTYHLITYTNNCFSSIPDALNGLPASPVAMLLIKDYFFHSRRGQVQRSCYISISRHPAYELTLHITARKAAASQYLIIEQRFSPELFHD